MVRNVGHLIRSSLKNRNIVIARIRRFLSGDEAISPKMRVAFTENTSQ